MRSAMLGRTALSASMRWKSASILDTAQYDVEYVYEDSSGYDETFRAVAADCISGAQMPLDALQAPHVKAVGLAGWP